MLQQIHALHSNTFVHFLCNAVQEGAFKPVSEHNELKFSLNKGEITNVLFTSRQLINLFT